MATLTLTTKDTATLGMLLRHGRATVLRDIKDLTFEDVIFPDGTVLKNVTFEQLADQVWAYSNKNNATLTLPSKS